MTEERAKYLLSLYFRQGCTPAEQEELYRWVHDADNEEGLRQALQEVWADFAPVDSIDDDRARQMLSEMMPAGRIRRISRKWMAAAAVLIVGGALSYHYFIGAKRDVLPAAPVAIVKPAIQKEDVSPGTTKATLTLGDGSAIVLDTVAGTAVASQGTTKILKQNGRVIYQNGDAAAAGPIYNTLSTARGHEYPLTLSDGTKVWLNASSSIRFPVVFDEKQRDVEITGEVYFEVAKSSKPFSVSAGGAIVQVLGTHFNINAYEDEARLNTTLLEGAVRITKGSSSLLLAPGQQAQIRKNGVIDLNRNADMEEAISWTQGYFHFTDASLETVLRQLSRWYDVDVVYERKPSEETFSGDIQKSLNLSQVLKILDKSQVKFQISGKRLIVIK
ncbi:MAG TPA: FecR domain-containing protein [Puia sp.]|jgi:ferric-dicitrate binding protein FerR (iron transport regulator)